MNFCFNFAHMSHTRIYFEKKMSLCKKNELQNCHMHSSQRINFIDELYNFLELYIFLLKCIFFLYKFVSSEFFIINLFMFLHFGSTKDFKVYYPREHHCYNFSFETQSSCNDIISLLCTHSTAKDDTENSTLSLSTNNRLSIVKQRMK